MADDFLLRFLHLLIGFLCTVHFQVFVEASSCSDGEFGWQCRFKCQCAAGEKCDPVTGECPNGCVGENWGPGCLLDSNCYYDKNYGNYYAGYKTDRRCLRWDSGHKNINNRFRNASVFIGAESLSELETYCRNPSKNTWQLGPWCHIESSDVYLACNIKKCECPDYRWSINCRKECHCKNSTEVCDKENGYCQSGCADGWMGVDCNQACLDGNFGPNCLKECHCSNNGEACNKATGECVSQCAPGWQGSDCQQRACNTNTFGEGCSGACYCKDPSHCDHVNGPTEDCECIKGYFNPPNCQAVRPPVITYFTNDKVNPGSSAEFTCIVSALPTPKAHNIKLSYHPGAPKKRITNKTSDSLGTTRTRTFRVANVNKGDTYICQVRAKAGTATKQIEPNLYELPVLRNAPNATDISGKTIRLEWPTWNKDQDVGDGPITDYTVEYSIHINKQNWRYNGILRSSHCSDKCVYFVNNLTPSTRYYFRIKTAREGMYGQGPPGKELEAKTKCESPSEGVTLDTLNTDVEQMDETKATITARWKLPQPINLNCEKIQTFFIYISQDPNFWDEPLTIPGERASAHTFAGLAPYTEYRVKVEFETNEGLRGPTSNVQKITTVEIKPPPPRNIQIINSNSTSLTIKWHHPRRPGGNITKYELQYWHTNSPDVKNLQTLSYPFRGLKVVLTNLKTSTNYTIRVRGHTVKGFGEWSSKLTGYTEETVPGPPDGIRNQSRTNNSIEISWRPPGIKGGKLLGYLVQCVVHNQNAAAGGEKKPHRHEAHPLQFNYIFTDMLPGTQYLCSVHARTSQGYGQGISTLVWTKPKKPSTPAMPEIIKTKSTDQTLTILLHPHKEQSVSIYRVVVEKIYPQNRKRRSLEKDTEEMYFTFTTYDEASQKNLTYYITAQLEPQDIGKSGIEFVIGDGKTYGGYVNPPLEKGQEYAIWYGVGTEADGEVDFTYTKTSQPVVAAKYIAPETDDAGGTAAAVIIGLLCVVLIIVIVALLLIRRRKVQQKYLLNSSHENDKTPELRHDAVIEVDESACTDSLLPPNSESTSTSEPLYGNMNAPIRPPVLVSELWEYVQKKRESPLDSPNNLRKEYEFFEPGLISKYEEAKRAENRHKNRYGNIIAYDHSRVVLEPLEGDLHSDYINANYIDGYKEPRAYIATQGPSRPTMADMWRMVWQQNSAKIVMVTNLVEDGRRKCDQYWPSEGIVIYGEITVEILEMECLTDYTIRTFRISRGAESKIVKQFHFTAWPDHGVPISPTSLLAFHKKVKSYIIPGAGPIVTHCSAGVGRTGTFIALDYLLDQAKVEGVVDIFNFVALMRTQRVKMIQTVDQYIFLHDALVEALTCGDTQILCSDLKTKYQQLVKVNQATQKNELEEQFEILQKITKFINRDDDRTVGLEPENVDKNRTRDIIPANRVRPYLMAQVLERDATDYINAAFINGFSRRDAYIVTQMPLPSTILDFWRMISDQGITAVIMLNEIDRHDETCQPYWPEEPGLKEYDPFTVEVMSMEQTEGLIIRNIKLGHGKQKEKFQPIKQFQLTCWPKEESLPTDKSVLLSLMDTMDKWLDQTGNGTVVIHCMDGATRSGLMCAILHIIERIKLAQEVDVMDTCKHLRINRKQLVPTQEQYQFCHEMALEYVDSIEPYANTSFQQTQHQADESVTVTS